MEIQCTGYDNGITLEKKNQNSIPDFTSIKVKDEFFNTIYFEKCQPNQPLNLSSWKCSPNIDLTIIE